LKKAFIVVGPESSGTRLMTKILIGGGCRGSAKHEQPFDTKSFKGQSPIVWRRSVPHRGKGLDLFNMIHKLEEYKIIVVVIVRDWYATELSQVANKHVDSIEDAKRNIKVALKEIFGQIIELRLDFILVPYESLILHPKKVQEDLLKRFELRTGIIQNIKNENAKWWWK